VLFPEENPLRKFLIAAVAALTVIGLVSVATAQTPGADLDVKVTPTNAGTKKKPKNSSLALEIVNGDTTRTMNRLTITLPRTVKLSAKGLTRCSEDTLEASGPSECPRAARLGKGLATAKLGVNTDAPQDLTFDVTPVILGAKKLGFYLAARELPVNVLAPGRISGRKLIIDVPQTAQQPAPGTWAGLVSLEAKLGARKGKNFLLSTTGCTRKKHKVKAALTFVDNGVSDAGTVNASTTSKCKK
jgi:hypothetical protein